MEVLVKKALLVFRKRAPHESDNARKASLIDIETIKKTFHNHHGLAVKHGPVQIEEDQRFAEPRWKTVSRLGWAERSPSVGH